MKNTSSKREVPVVIGSRVRLTQQTSHGGECWTSSIEGNVLSAMQEKTGAWYAHSRDKKLWLDRIVIGQDNGEISSCILDQYSRLKRVDVHNATQAVLKNQSKKR